MKVKKVDLLIYICFFILIFQMSVLSYCSGIFLTLDNYLDELVFIVLLVNGIFHYKKVRKLLCFERRIIWWLVLLICIGIISSMVFSYQNIQCVFIDIVACTKFFIVYFSVRLLDKNNAKRIISGLSKIVTPIVYFSTIILFVQLFIYPIYSTAGYRYFMESQVLWFAHPTVMSIFFITLALVQIGSLAVNGKKRVISLSIFFCFLLAASSMRTKSIGAVIAIIVVYLCTIKYKKYAKRIGVVGGGVVSLFFAWDQLVFYFGKVAQSRDDFIRAKLLRDSFTLAIKHFPLGTGLGTFGSNIAAEHYSPLYSLLGYAGLPGGSETDNWALSDSFWPIVLGQFGFVGLIIFLIILFELFRIIISTNKINLYLFWGAISTLIYLIVCSIAESAFFHPNSVPLAIILALYINIAVSSNGEKTV